MFPWVFLEKNEKMVSSSFQTWEELASEISGFSREKIHRGWNEQKLGSSLKQPAEQTTDVASVAEDIDDTEYELPPGQYQMFFDYIHVDSEFFIKFR